MDSGSEFLAARMFMSNHMPIQIFTFTPFTHQRCHSGTHSHYPLLGASSLSSERACAIYNHVTMGNSLSVHSDLRGHWSVHACTVFTNVTEKTLF